MRHLYTSILAAAALVAVPVHAQDAAQIDAVASFERAEASLAVTPANNVSFGRVAIPNRDQGSGISCGYNLGFADAGRTLRAGRFEIGDTTTPPGTGPTLSGCQYFDSQQALGLFTVGCDPDRAVDFALRYSNSAATGILFERGENSIPFRFFEAGGTTPLINISSPALTPDGGAADDVPCPAGGVIDAVVGGRLSVGVNAAPGDNLVVGTITVEVNY
jgi:hypothetical protein